MTLACTATKLHTQKGVHLSHMEAWGAGKHTKDRGNRMASDTWKPNWTKQKGKGQMGTDTDNNILRKTCLE